VSYWTGGEGVASSQLSVTIGRQARQKVGPSDCHAAINLKLKEWFPDLQRYVKFRTLKNLALKKHIKPRSPTNCIQNLGLSTTVRVIRQDSSY